jgi:hypothetical protein
MAAEHPTEELLGSVGEFLVALAVVREERASSPAFLNVFTTVLQRLEGLSERDQVRWENLIWFVLSWGLRRRPEEEQTTLLEAARESQREVRHQEEMRKMSETVFQNWEETLLARGQSEGIAALRRTLRRVVRSRFGGLSEGALAGIESARDLPTLENWIEKAALATSIDEVEQFLTEPNRA